MTNFLQLLLSGVLVGSVYGLIAMGFVIVYRSSRVFNMAYGQFAVLGAFMAWTFIGSPDSPRLPFPLAIFLTLLFAIGFGLLVERVLFSRLIGRPIFSGFILSLGILALLNNVILIIWGPRTFIFAERIPTGTVNLGSIVLAKEYVLTFIIAVIAIIVLVILFKRTKLGLAIRAAYDNQLAARCLGVSVRLISQIAWCLCTLLATVGGILIASVQGASMLLSELVMVTLAVVLLGGLDSMVGCIIGGLVLAIGENLASYYLGRYLPGIEGVFPLIMVLLILIIRPNGLFGTKPVERV